MPTASKSESVTLNGVRNHSIEGTNIFTDLHFSTYLSMAHPVSESQFDVLPSPDVHSIIKASDFEKVFLLHSECATDEGRGPKRTVV